jgi:hypothetical protein
VDCECVTKLHVFLTSLFHIVKLLVLIDAIIMSCIVDMIKSTDVVVR